MNKLTKGILALAACSMLVGCNKNDNNNNGNDYLKTVQSGGEAFKEKIKQYSLFEYQNENAIFITEISYVYVAEVIKKQNYIVDNDVGNILMTATCLVKDETGENKKSNIYGKYSVKDDSIAIDTKYKMWSGYTEDYKSAIDRNYVKGIYGNYSTL